MRPATYHLKLKRGDDYSLVFKRTDAAGVAIDFTGWAFQLEFKRNYDDATVADLELTGGEITFSTPYITANFSSAKTIGLSGSYVYDLRGTYSGKVTTLIQGEVTITPSVTEL